MEIVNRPFIKTLSSAQGEQPVLALELILNARNPNQSWFVILIKMHGLPVAHAGNFGASKLQPVLTVQG